MIYYYSLIANTAPAQFVCFFVIFVTRTIIYLHILFKTLLLLLLLSAYQPRHATEIILAISQNSFGRRLYTQTALQSL